MSLNISVSFEFIFVNFHFYLNLDVYANVINQSFVGVKLFRTALEEYSFSFLFFVGWKWTKLEEYSGQRNM